MSSLKRFPTSLVCAALVALCGSSGGCGRPSSTIALVSYKDPYFPEPYTVAFSQCAYRVDAGGDYHVVARTTRTSQAEGDGPITQLLYVHLFWKPQPGRTFAEKTTNDAMIRYVIATERGVAAYTGTGFAYPKRRRFGGGLIFQLESARLRLVALTGQVPELLGDARLSGKLFAAEDPSLTVEVLRELELYSAGVMRERRASTPGD